MDRFEEYKIQASLPQKASLVFLNSYSDEEILFFKKIKRINGEISREYFDIVSSMKDQINVLIGKLTPLYELGLKFDVYLAGGALRDLLLNNENNIRDLDIIFDFSGHIENNKKKLSEISVFVLNKIFDTQINKTQWEEMDTKQKSFFMIFNLLQKEYNIEKSHTLEELKNKSSLSNETYKHLLNKDLEAVISISDSNLTYPMDILVINTNIDKYLDTFSFDFCKVKLQVLNLEKSKIITNVYDFLQLIHVPKNFIKDAVSKTLTLRMDKYSSVEFIEKILTKHYGKIKYKYQDYKINLEPGNSDMMAKFKETYEASISLENLLPIKSKHIAVQHELKI